MKTATSIELRKPNTAINIQKGTILKSLTDLFIVAEAVTEEGGGDTISSTLWHVSFRPARYILVSLTTGSSFFGEPAMELNTLQSKIRHTNKLQMVSSISFVEN